MTWHEAMERYGTDKPDLRFGMELVDVERGVRGHRVPGVPGRGGKGHPRRPARATCRARSSTRSIERAKQLGAGGLVWMRVGDGGSLDAPVAKFLSEPEQLGLVDATGADER